MYIGGASASGVLSDILDMKSNYKKTASRQKEKKKTGTLVISGLETIELMQINTMVQLGLFFPHSPSR